MSEQIECIPYRCSLSAESCAARHALAQEPGRVGRARAHLVHCRGCAEGRERWVALGKKRREAASCGPRPSKRPLASEAYAPRVGQP